MELRQRLASAADGYSARWWIDLLFLAIAVAAWWLLGHWRPAFPDSGAAYYASCSSFAGIVLAAATFTCALFFQSDKPLLRRLRDVYREDARVSWTWILSSLLGSAVVPLGAATASPVAPEFSFAAATGSVVVATLSFIRVVLWFRVIARAPEGDRPDGENDGIDRTTFTGLGPRT